MRVKEGGDLDNKDLLLHPKEYSTNKILISRQPCKDCEQNINGPKIVNDCGQCESKWAGDTCSIQGNTQNILKAAESGNLNRVKKILEEDINNNDSNVFLEKDSNGNTALHLASRKGHDNVCEYLLNYPSNLINLKKINDLNDNLDEKEEMNVIKNINYFNELKNIVKIN